MHRGIWCCVIGRVRYGGVRGAERIGEISLKRGKSFRFALNIKFVIFNHNITFQFQTIPKPYPH